MDCSGQSLPTGRGKRANGVILGKAVGLAGEEGQSTGRIILRDSDSGRSRSPGRQGRWEGKNDSSALGAFRFPREAGYDVN